jgi:hypothetical protein
VNAFIPPEKNPKSHPSFFMISVSASIDAVVLLASFLCSVFGCVLI